MKESIRNRLYLLYKLIRPIIPISSGLGTWIIARYCEAPFEQALAAAISIALSTIGASFYHYGGANWMYARKAERFKFQDPEVVRLIGLGIFSLSICIASMYLPKQCVLICVFNTFAIAAYSAKLSSHWTTKNLTMGIISATPIVIGWQAGTVTHPIVLWAIGIACTVHLSREIIKDVQDIITNQGKRVTLPMILGIEQALQISGFLLLIGAVLSLVFLQFTAGTFQATMAVISTIILALTGAVLLIKKKPGSSKTLIYVSICFILLALW